MMFPSAQPLSSSSLSSRRRLNVRSLNKEFQLFRNNAVQKRRFKREKFRFHVGEGGEDRVRLLSDHDEDEEAGEAGGGGGRGGLNSSSSFSPPLYARRAESLSLDLDRLSASVEGLETLLRQRTERPLFDEVEAEEGEADAMTREVQRGVREAHSELGRMTAAAAALRGGLEARLAGNMARALTERLKEIMERFGSAQTLHLKRVKARETKTQRYFHDFVEPEEDPVGLLGEASATNGRISTQELVQLEETSRALQQREKDINKVVRSIADLNAIFQDLARMVTEQGEVVDRIDCNIENTQMKVESGVRELKKAEQHQRKNRKMKCIVILAVIVIILLFVLLIKIS